MFQPPVAAGGSAGVTSARGVPRRSSGLLCRELDIELNASLSPPLFPRQDALFCEHVFSPAVSMGFRALRSNTARSGRLTARRVYLILVCSNCTTARTIEKTYTHVVYFCEILSVALIWKSRDDLRYGIAREDIIIQKNPARCTIMLARSGSSIIYIYIYIYLSFLLGQCHTAIYIFLI